MREDTDQNNSEYEHFSVTVICPILFEWFSLLLRIWTDILQIGAGFVITNRGKYYYKLGWDYYKSGQLLPQIGVGLLQIGAIITNRCTTTVP